MTRLLSVALIVILAKAATGADVPRVLPEGRQPADRRLEPLSDLKSVAKKVRL